MEASTEKRIVGDAGRLGLLMLGDQSLNSLGNFLTGNILARFLPPAQYGAYGLILETMFFLNGLQGALINYPLTVDAAGGDRQNLKRLATAALMLTVALLPIVGIAMGLAAGFAGGAAVGVVAVGAMVLWQAQELMRRGLIAHRRIAACIPGDCVSYLGQAGGMFILHQFGHLTLVNAMLVVGATSAAALLIQAAQVGLARISFEDAWQIAGRFWRVGRWAALGGLTALLTILGYPWVLRLSWGADAVGVLLAISMPLRVTNPVMSSIGGLIVPAVARSLKRDGPRAAARPVIAYGLLGLALLLPCYLILFFAPTFTLRVCFGPASPYVSAGPLLRIWTLNWALMYVAVVLSSWLLGLHESRLQFKAQLIHATAAAAISLPATILFGMHGLVVAAAAATFIDVVAIAWLVRCAIREAQIASRLTRLPAQASSGTFPESIEPGGPLSSAGLG